MLPGGVCCLIERERAHVGAGARLEARLIGDLGLPLLEEGQVLRLEIPEFVVVGGRREGDGEDLMPTLPTADAGPVSAAALLLKAKHFDDGLYAAVELAAQDGAGRFPGKSSLLRSLAALYGQKVAEAQQNAAVATNAAQEASLPQTFAPEDSPFLQEITGNAICCFERPRLSTVS